MGRCWECLPIPLEKGRLTLGRTYNNIMKSRLAISFGEVADREMKHPGEKASVHLGASGKEASGIRGTRAPRAESRPGFPWPTHCPGPAGFRSSSHRGP